MASTCDPAADTHLRMLMPLRKPQAEQRVIVRHSVGR
jgi:hypothetical protein